MGGGAQAPLPGLKGAGSPFSCHLGHEVLRAPLPSGLLTALFTVGSGATFAASNWYHSFCPEGWGALQRWPDLNAAISTLEPGREERWGGFWEPPPTCGASCLSVMSPGAGATPSPCTRGTRTPHAAHQGVTHVPWMRSVPRVLPDGLPTACLRAEALVPPSSEAASETRNHWPPAPIRALRCPQTSLPGC